MYIHLLDEGGDKGQVSFLGTGSEGSDGTAVQVQCTLSRGQNYGRAEWLEEEEEEKLPRLPVRALILISWCCWYSSTVRRECGMQPIYSCMPSKVQYEGSAIGSTQNYVLAKIDESLRSTASRYSRYSRMADEGGMRHPASPPDLDLVTSAVVSL